MRPFTTTISIAEARAIIEAGMPRIERRERVPLLEPAWACAGRGRGRRRRRTALRPGQHGRLRGRRRPTLPARRASQPVHLRLAGRVYTGDVPTARVEPGACVEIATGAPMPEGADAVIMVEETALDGDTVAVFASVRPGAEHRAARRGHLHGTDRARERRGSERQPDWRAGGARARGRRSVWARPSVAVLSTGNEIARAGRAARARADLRHQPLHACRRSSPSTAASRCRWPPRATRCAALHAALDECLRHDLIVFSGGSSVGERDLILDVIRERGEVRFHGIAVKPGKPTLFGQVEGHAGLRHAGLSRRRACRTPTSCSSRRCVAWRGCR